MKALQAIEQSAQRLASQGPHRHNRGRSRAGARLFAAATLARIQPDHAALDSVWNLWATIASRTFASGRYDADNEIQAHRELTGALVRNSYLVLSNKYALSLLGARALQLLPAVERALVDWVWHKRDGIGYLNIALSQPPIGSASVLDRWFTSMELLSCFPRWQRVAKDGHPPDRSLQNEPHSPHYHADRRGFDDVVGGREHRLAASKDLASQ